MGTTLQDVRGAIRKLGLSCQPVCLHSSLRSIGHVEGGADAVIEAFLLEDCTMLVPTFSYDFQVPPPEDLRPKRNAWDYDWIPGLTKGIDRVYTPATNDISREEMGAIPAAVLARPNRVRGNHPICSFAAIGKFAGQLVHDQTPMDVFSPLRVLCELGGLAVLIGVDLDRMTLLHAAEELAGRNPFVRWANDSEGRPIAAAMGGCSDGFLGLSTSLSSLAQTCTVGRSRWTVYPARGSMNAAEKAIRETPEITDCGNPNCDRCRDAILGGPVW